MHRDLKLPNIMMNFAELPQNICAGSAGLGFNLVEYIRNLDFENKHHTVTSKLADLGFARKLGED